MRKREQLQERYEDALFALMMDTLDRMEGCSALELHESLPKEIPPDIEKKCLGMISSYFKKSHANTVRRKTFKIINKIAVVVLLCILLFTTAFATSPTFRAAALNFVIEVFDDHTEFRMEPSYRQISSLENGTIIEDWRLDECVFEGTEGGSKNLWNSYSFLDGGYMEIVVYMGENSVVAFDTEDALIEDCIIQEKDAMCIEKGDVIQVVWTDEEQGLVWEVYGTNVSKEKLLYVAEHSFFECSNE